MTEKRYYVRIKDEETQKFLDSQPNQNTTIGKILTDYVNGDLVSSNESNLDLEIKKAKLKKLNAEGRIKEFEANQLEIYKDTFGIPPSKQTQKVIEKGAHERENTNQEIENVMTHFEFIEKSKVTGEMSFVCKHCVNMLYSEESKMIQEMSRHIQAMHSKEILEK